MLTTTIHAHTHTHTRCEKKKHNGEKNSRSRSCPSVLLWARMMQSRWRVWPLELRVPPSQRWDWNEWSSVSVQQCVCVCVCTVPNMRPGDLNETNLCSMVKLNPGHSYLSKGATQWQLNLLVWVHVLPPIKKLIFWLVRSLEKQTRLQMSLTPTFSRKQCPHNFMLFQLLKLKL